MFRELLILGSLAFNVPATATNLIANGDFQTGDLTGWSAVGLSGSDVLDWGGGDYQLSAQNPWGDDKYIEQQFTTTPGETYAVAFRLSGGSAFNPIWVKTQIGAEQFTEFGGFNETDIAYSYLATGALTNIRFAMLTNFNMVRADDFAVALATAPVPEPATWTLMISGFLLLGAALRQGSHAMAPGKSA